MTGEILDSQQTELTRRALLGNALELIEIAEMFDGRVIPSEPPKKDGEFVYFEIMFRNYTDCTDFLKVITNEPSE